MPEPRTRPARVSSSSPEPFPWYENPDASTTESKKWRLGLYHVKNLAQDQAIVKIHKGSCTDIYQGLRIGTDEDSQSDYCDTAPGRLIPEESLKAILDFVQRICNTMIEQSEQTTRNLAWESEYNTREELLDPDVTEEQIGESPLESQTDDVFQWTPDQLASAILAPDAESDMPCLRRMILTAEDASFTVEQSKQLAPRLLSFAEKYRDSNNPQDESAVWSAIRTGASMLRPQDADRLRPLLEPGHPIETSLVTVKMIGRIFEAQPPAKLDQHQSLVNELFRIANLICNPYAVTEIRSAAIAQLAIYALAAMASSKINPIIKEVQKLNVTWFTQRTLRKLQDLDNIWANHTTPVRKAPRQLLNRMVKTLQ